MRTRTFIGLIILMIVLLVVSSPTMLEQMARGVETAAERSGAPALQPQPQPDADPSATLTPLDSSLELKGFTVDPESGDLRDIYPEGERTYNHAGRLVQGYSRRALPGEKSTTDAWSVPYQGAESMLLDRDGCPMFRPETDVAKLLADDVVRQRYESRVATAEDPAACRVLFAQRRDEATTLIVDDTLPQDARDLRAMANGGTDGAAITLEYYTVLEEFFDVEGIAKAAAAER